MRLPRIYFKRNCDTLLFLALGFITFYLCVNYSRDWINYNFWYQKKANEVSWYYFYTHYNPLKEWLYHYVSKAVGALIGFAGFAMVATVTSLFFKLRYLGKIIDNPFIATFFYVCIYLLLLEGTVMRVGYALSLIVIALYCLKIQKYFGSFLLIMIASQIHLSAILFLVIFPLYFFKRLNLIVYLTFLLAPLLIVFDVAVFDLFRQVVLWANPRYLQYDGAKLLTQNSTGLYLYFIAFFMVWLLTIGFYLQHKIRQDRFAATLYSVAVLGVVAMCLFHDHVAMGARLGELLLIPIVILLSWMYMQFLEQKKYTHQIILVSIYALYFLARLVYLYPTMFS